MIHLRRSMSASAQAPGPIAAAINRWAQVLA